MSVPTQQIPYFCIVNKDGCGFKRKVKGKQAVHSIISLLKIDTAAGKTKASPQTPQNTHVQTKKEEKDHRKVRQKKKEKKKKKKTNRPHAMKKQ